MMKLAGALLMVLSAGLAGAETPQSWQVEIVVFQNLAGSERTPVSAPGQAAGESPGSLSPPGATAYPLLGDAELGLSGIYRRLGQSASYRPLADFGWRQPLASPEASATFVLPQEIVSRSAVSGSVRLFRQNSVYLELTLTFAPPGKRPARIHELRKIRGTGLQYFDHPEFGVIARVRPIEPSSGAAESPPQEAGSARVGAEVAGPGQ